MVELSDPSGSQAVLIGAQHYDHRQDLPAVAANLRALAALLTNPAYWGLAAERCRVLADPVDPGEVSRILRQAATETTPAGALFIYYGGHGMIHPDDGSLVLALSSTDPEFPDEAGLPYHRVTRAVKRAAAGRRIVVLDCCYAARADGPHPLMPGSESADMATRAEVEACLVAAAGRNEEASAKGSGGHTVFTGELLRVLRQGISGGGPFLTVQAVWNEVKRGLNGPGQSRPVLRDYNSSASMPLLRNAASSPTDLVGTVLFANRGITDPDLNESAVLVLKHNETGALGVRLTRPIEQPAGGGFFDEWHDLVGQRPAMFDGGPVGRDGTGIIAVARLRPGVSEPERFSPLNGRIGTMPLGTPAAEFRERFSDVWVFAGYLGWSPGELERYLENETLVRSDQHIGGAFGSDPGHLWHSLVNRHDRSPGRSP